MDTILDKAPQASRRQFIGGAGALALAFRFGDGLASVAHADAARQSFEPNALIRLEADGTLTVVSSYLEMGQGTFTGIATLAAEELDIGMDKVRVVAAPADVSKYVNPILAKWGFAYQATGGSTAMAGSWSTMRQAAAAARQMLLSAAAKKWNVPAASLRVEDGVVIHDASHRRAPYGELIAAARREPVPAQVSLKAPAQFKLVGSERTRRVDIPEKVNGRAVYTQDIKLPDMLVAVVAHPPRLWGRVKHVDATRAKAIPGVVAVVEFPGDHEVQAGVAVLARNTWVARQGRDALSIQWDDTDALRMGSEQIRAQFRTLAGQPGVVAVNRGDVTASFQGAKVLEAVYEQPYLAHAAMEPLNCAVHLHQDICEIWNGEQWHTGDQQMAARELGFKVEQVKIHQLYAGGSFGRRANPRSDYIREAVRIAAAARRQGITVPVKMVYMREDDMRAAQYRPLTVHKVKLAVDHGGNLVSWQQTVVGQSFFPPTDPKAVDHNLLEGAEDMPYEIPNFRVVQHNPATVAVPTQWIRSVGHTHTALVCETMMDEAARLAGKDPYQFRRALLAKHPRERAVLDLAAQKAGWSKPLEAGPHGSHRARGIAFQQSFGTYVAQVAEVTVHQDGSYSVDRVVCAVDCGTVINPDIVAAQIEGGVGFGLSFLRQAITFEDGHVKEGNFNDYPVLRMDGMPRVETYTVPSQEAPTGVGEPGVPPVAPAVVNALTAATGVSIRSLPIRTPLQSVGDDS